MINVLLALLAFRFLPKVLPFLPLISLAIFDKPLLPCLYLALGTGLFVDLFSTSTPFGFTALLYSVSTLLIHPLKWYITTLKIYSLALFTTLLSLTTTSLALLITPLSFSSLTDLLVMPLIDGLFAFCWFSCPHLAYTQGRRLWLKFQSR